MSKWLYTLKIKDVFQNQAPDVDDDDHAIACAPFAEQRVRDLIARVQDKPNVGDLYAELDEVADTFASIKDDLGGSPSSVFNEAMTLLYNAGDFGRRVWVS